MDQLLFGTGGVPHSTRPRSTAAGIGRIAELGLGCMEIEFVRGVRMSEAGALEVSRAAAEHGIKLSVHAPYYINFNAHDPLKLEASRERLIQAARTGAMCGAQTVVVHTAFYLGDPPDEVFRRVKNRLEETVRRLRQENNRITVRPEIMGKGSEFGSLEEVLDLCTETEGLAPGIDFAHLHARAGAANSYAEFTAILGKIEKRLGRVGLDDIHIHFSGINYGAKGELNHLNLEESDLRYRELLRALHDFDVKGLVICESPNLEGDARLLQTTYRALKSGG